LPKPRTTTVTPPPFKVVVSANPPTPCLTIAMTKTLYRAHIL
jgi:hypothetical protein